VIGLGRAKILLLVVPPHTDPDIAHDAMMAAAAPSNGSTVADLLAPTDDHRSTFRKRIRKARP
jgi:hypothetical protein